jgi:hypothetical protein
MSFSGNDASWNGGEVTLNATTNVILTQGMVKFRGTGSVDDTGNNLTISDDTAVVEIVGANGRGVRIGNDGLTAKATFQTGVAHIAADTSVNLSASGKISLPVLGSGIAIKEGVNATMGVATLAAGTVTVLTTKVTATSRIQLTGQSDGGTVGFQRVSARTASTSFVITSSSATDTSTVAWFIIEPS